MLRSNQISCIDNSTFTGLSSVRLLSLYDNRISSIAPGAFSTLHSLSTMWVISDAFSPCFWYLFMFFSILLFLLSQHVPQSPLVYLQIWLNIPHRLPLLLSLSLSFLCLYLSVSTNFSDSTPAVWLIYHAARAHTHAHICTHVALWTLFSSQMLSIIID